MKKTILILSATIILLGSFTLENLYSKLFEIAKNWEQYQPEEPNDVNYQEMGTWIPESGVRGKYFYFKDVLGLNTLEALTGEKVFTNNVHRSVPNYHAKTDFGYYNPKFVKSVRKTFNKLAKNDEFMKLTQSIYDEELKGLARIYYLSYKYLENNPKIKENVTKKYLKKIEKPTDEAGYLLQEEFRTFAEQKSDNEGYDVYEAFTAPGFWIRRGIDETDDEFFKLLQSVFTAYDSNFMKENK